MINYIDTEKLIAEIERFSATEYGGNTFGDDVANGALDYVLEEIIPSLQQEQPEPYFYCKYGGTIPLCSDCKRNHSNSSFKTEEITTWYVPSNGTKHCIDYIQQEQPEIDLEKFTEKIKTFQGRYKHPEIVSIKGAMAFMARMFYQYPDVARLWYEQLPKTTMD